MIKTVKADKFGTFVVNGKPYKELTKDELDELKAWFMDGNKAEPLYTELEKAKMRKISELTQNAKEHKNRSVPIKIGSKTYNFFGGRINAQKYQEALAIGAKEVGVEEGIIKITKPQIENAIQAILSQAYDGWIKLNEIAYDVNKAKKIEDIDYIEW